MKRKTKAELEKEIEELRRSIAELQGSEPRAGNTAGEYHRLLQAVLEGTPDPVFLKDRKGRYRLCNTATAHALGQVSVEEVTGKDDADLLPAEMASRLAENDRHTMGSGESAEYEEWIPTVGGQRLFRTKKTPFRNETGAVVGLLGVARDITERKHAEEALAISEKRHGSYIEVTGQLAWTTNADGEVVEPVPTWQAYTGQSHDETKGRGWTKAIHPDDAGRASQTWQEAIRTRSAYETEFRVLGKDGRYRWFLSRAVPSIDEDGSIREWVGTCINIDQIRAAREQLRQERDRYEALVNSIPDAVYSALPDGSGTITFMSGRWEQWTGYTPQDSHNDHGSWPRSIHPDDVERAVGGYTRACTEGKDYEGEYRLVHKDTGQVRWVRDRGVAVKDQTGQVIRVDGIVTDITERRRAEEALGYHQMLLREMGRIAHIGGWEFDPATGKGTWTAEAARIHDLDPADETSIEEGLSFYRGQSRARIDQAVKQAIESGKPYDLELELTTATGARKWVRTIGSPVMENGKVVRVRGSFQDITERKGDEEKLARSEQFLASVIEQNPGSLWISDGAGTLVRMNRACRELFGVTEEEVVGKYCILEDNLIEAQGHMPLVRDVFDKGEIARFTIDYDVRELKNIKAKGGTRRILDVVASPIRDPQGTVTNAIVQHRDVTDLRQAEQELRKHRDHLEALVEERTAELRDLVVFSNAILDTAPVGIIAYRADGQCISANESAGPLVGATREQVLGQNFRALASWQESELLSAADRCLQTGEPQRSLLSASTTFGKEVILDARFARFMAHGAAHLLLTVTDITERVRSEQALREYSNQLEAANRELEAFAYSVSHDLRTPLRSIDGFSQALLEDYGDKVDEQGKQQLRRVRAAAQRMAQLIEDLLRLSRITRWEMEHRKVDISALARTALASLQQSQPDRDVEVIIADGLEAHGDIRLLQIVMENLLANAWKFSGRRNSARIEVGEARNGDLGPRNPELPGDAVVYFVRDNGAGFDMAYTDKLFGAFQRLHSMSEFEGTGVGLATVQRAVLRHGGRVWAVGEEGKGATFFFTLGERESEEERR